MYIIFTFAHFMVNKSLIEFPTTTTLMSEVQTLRQELADTQKKLQGYADTGQYLVHAQYQFRINFHSNISL